MSGVFAFLLCFFLVGRVSEAGSSFAQRIPPCYESWSRLSGVNIGWLGAYMDGVVVSTSVSRLEIVCTCTCKTRDSSSILLLRRKQLVSSFLSWYPTFAAGHPGTNSGVVVVSCRVCTSRVTRAVQPPVPSRRLPVSPTATCTCCIQSRSSRICGSTYQKVTCECVKQILGIGR